MKIKKIVKIGGILIASLYVVACAYLYYSQEGILFHPEKLKRAHAYTAPNSFEEIDFETKDGLTINALLQKVERPKGLILYFHGNVGNCQTWASIGKIYCRDAYNLCIVDYRGFGKSEGKITNEQQLFDDAQVVYDAMKKRFPETKIHVIGYSIGTAIASELASRNNPKQLILLAPYYNMRDMMDKRYPIFPHFLLRYELDNAKYVAKIKAPISIFHGLKDEAIAYDSSIRLKKKCKQGDQLVLLKNQGHNEINDNKVLHSYLSKLLPEW